MLALLIIGGLAPFTFIKDKDGNPLMSLSDLTMPDAKMPDISLPNLLDAESNPLALDGAVYKWKNKQGTWQFSSAPPPKEMAFTSTVYDQNMNVIQAVKTPSIAEKKPEEAEEQEEPEDEVSSGGLSNLGKAYSPEKVKKLFDDANNLESLLNNRAKQQQEILDNL